MKNAINIMKIKKIWLEKKVIILVLVFNKSVRLLDRIFKMFKTRLYCLSRNLQLQNAHFYVHVLQQNYLGYEFLILY